MSTLFGAALAACTAAAGAQYYPQATLYVVATPIGNLADISLRALHVLGLVDTIACEDTRHTQTMLRAYGIDKGQGQLIALHQHNEMQATQLVLDRLHQGQRVACVSDAGTPGISDPGARLVAAVQAQGLRVVPLPGPSSVTTLLCAAGLVQTPASFIFVGFLPTKAGERDLAIQELAMQQRAAVLLEAPHRMETLARVLAPLGARTITIGRELTKQFEEIATFKVQDMPHWLAQDSQRLRGEFTLVLHPAAPVAESGLDTRALELLLPHLPLKTAVKLAAQISGAPRNALYQAALTLQTKPSS